MTEKQEAALRQAREALKESHPEAYRHTLAAIDEALADQPAQQDYWQEEARRYAQNAEFWRGKYEAATAQQQEPVEWGVDWGRAGDQSCVSIIKRLSGGGIEVLATEYGPPASKPWVGLTDDERLALAMHENFGSVTDYACAIEAKLREKNAQPSKPLTDEQRKAIVVCFTSGKVSVSEVQRKLAISYNEAQQLCQSIVDLKLAQGLQLAPSLDRHGIKGDA